MKSKTVIKIIVDAVMTVMLFILMAFMITGQQIHEWTGTGMSVVFVLHNLLNFRWYWKLFKGRYTPIRIFQTAINIMMIISMICLIYSGIVMSRYIFIKVSGSIAMARKIHLMSSHWTFILISMHIGIHWNMVCGILKKITFVKQITSIPHIFFMLTALIISAIGVYSFVSNNIFSYLTLKAQFLFFDFQKPIVLFFMQYFSIMVLFASVSNYFFKILDYIKEELL